MIIVEIIRACYLLSVIVEKSTTRNRLRLALWINQNRS